MDAPAPSLSPIPISASMSAIPVEQEARRKPNFSDGEKEFLISRYEVYKQILSAKGSDGVTIRHKLHVWHCITEELAAQNLNVRRSVKEVKKKWENLAVQSRKDLADFRQNQHLAHAAPPSARALKVLELLGEITLQKRPDDNGVVIYETPPDASGIGPLASLIKQECVFPSDDQNSFADRDRRDGGERATSEAETMSNSMISTRHKSGLSTPSPVLDHSRSMANDSVLDNFSSFIRSRPNESSSTEFACANTPNQKRRLDDPTSFDEGAFSSQRNGCTCTCAHHRRPNNDDTGDLEMHEDMKKMKRLKLQLETEKLMLEKQKLELEIRYLLKKLESGERVNAPA